MLPHVANTTVSRGVAIGPAREPTTGLWRLKLRRGPPNAQSNRAAAQGYDTGPSNSGDGREHHVRIWGADCPVGLRAQNAAAELRGDPLRSRGEFDARIGHVPRRSAGKPLRIEAAGQWEP